MDKDKSRVHRYKSLQLGTAPAIFITARPRNLIAIALIAAIAGWFRLGGGLTTFPSDVKRSQRPAVQTMVDGVHRNVSADAVDQYHVTRKNGSLIEICAQARMVSAAYLRENDKANYVKWKATEVADCKAGDPTEK